jgi:hypothetical protein
MILLHTEDKTSAGIKNVMESCIVVISETQMMIEQLRVGIRENFTSEATNCLHQYAGLMTDKNSVIKLLHVGGFTQG